MDIPRVNVAMNDDKTEVTVSVTFPWYKQADAFAKICRAILMNMQPVVEGEDHMIVNKPA